MEQYFAQFLMYLKEVKHSSENTLLAYRNDLRKLLAFFEKQGITRVDRIGETALNSYVLTLEREGMSPASVSRNIASMKAFILYLIKQGVIQGDPSERIRPPKVQKKSPQIIESELVNQLLEQPDLKSMKGIRDRAILELLYATGIKVTELIGVKLSDINLSGRYITCGETKERNVPFGKEAQKALKNYLAIRSDSFDRHQSELLFLNTMGEQLSRQGLWKILKGYADKIGLKEMNPNIIRHTFAAHMLDNGADLSSIQEFLGHADIASTQLYLAHSYKNSREVYMNTHPRA